MNTVEGQISIRLFPGNRHERVAIQSSRPLHAARVLIGKTPQQAMEVIPLLFNVCGTAQSRAALLAMRKEGAQEGLAGISSGRQMETARDMLVLVENAREHLMRLFTDWPRLFSLPTDNNNLAYLSQLQSTFHRALFDAGRAFAFDSVLNGKASEADRLIVELDRYLQDHVFACKTGPHRGRATASPCPRSTARSCADSSTNPVAVISSPHPNGREDVARPPP